MSYRVLLMEFFSIVFGLAIGYMIIEWSEHRAERKSAEKAVARIMAEIASNKNNLERHKRYYDAILYEIDSISAIRSIKSLNDLPSWTGPTPPLIKTSTYRVALSMGTLDYVDFDLVRQLDEVYSVAEAFRSFVEGTVNFSILGNNVEDVRFQEKVLRIYSEYAKVFLVEASEVNAYLNKTDDL